MAPTPLTDYEKRRLDNIRRNGEMMAALNLRSAVAAAAAAAAAGKRYSPATEPAKKKRKYEKTNKSVNSSPIVLRRSLRTKGLPPSADQSSDYTPRSLSLSAMPPPARLRDTLTLHDAFIDKYVSSPSSDQGLVDAIKYSAQISKRDTDDIKQEAEDTMKMMKLKEDHVIKLVPDRILAVRFFPFIDQTVVAVGDKTGHVGLWDSASGRVYLYAPHSGSVSGISAHPSSRTKMFTCSYDGLMRLMDFERETFSVVYSSDYSIYSICQQPNNSSSIYIGEGPGYVKIWDERMRKVASTWSLHEQRINTIDINTQNTNLMATSSSDGKACIWDLRSMSKDKPTSLKIVKHNRAAQSAFFSPSGNSLATTSLDDNVRVLSGSNYDDMFIVRHNNQTGRWLSTFRAIWGWDDSYLYLGNMGRAVDIISVNNKITTHLISEHMTSIPCRFAAHPFIKGSLACGTAGGKVFLWTRE